jgi:hypothetical protein
MDGFDGARGWVGAKQVTSTRGAEPKAIFTGRLSRTFVITGTVSVDSNQRKVNRVRTAHEFFQE